MGGGEETGFWIWEKSPLLRKVHRNRYNEKTVIKTDIVRISYTSLNVVKVMIDETCNTHGVGLEEREYEKLIGSHQVGMSLDNIVCVVV
jgi:hypothetical protein